MSGRVLKGSGPLAVVATGWAHFRTRLVRATPASDQRCAGVQQRSNLSTEWLTGSGRRAPGAIPRTHLCACGSRCRPHTLGSLPWTAARPPATVHRKGLAPRCGADDSVVHRRNPSAPVRSPTEPSTVKGLNMKNLLQRFVNLFSRLQTNSLEEQYLAQAVDAQDLQVRLHALERARP